jgi:drug/metabolite transporter (DMT)-like permease
MRNFSSRTEGLVAINIAAVIFGSAALYGKLSVSPCWIVAMRAGFGALTLMILMLYKKDIRPLPRALLPGIVFTGFLLAVHWLTFFASVQLAGVAIATLTFATFPLFTVLIEALHQRRKPHLIEIAAAVAIIIAVALLVNPHHNGPDSFTGAAAGLASGLSYAWFWHAGKALNKALPPVRLSFYQNAATSLLLAPFLLFSAPAPHRLEEWAWLVMLGIVNTALMLQLYLYALKRISASTCSGFVALEPVYAIFLAAVFFHERITAWIAVSAALIVCASFTLLKLETGND